MKQNMIVWTYRLGLSAVVAGMFVGAYGCNLQEEGCADSLTCGKPNTATGPIMADTENCQNGLDDDKDGQADCKDLKCAKLVFCNARQDGWQFHAVTMDVYGAKPVPDCIDGQKAERLYEGHKGQPICEACTCSNNAQAPMTCEGSPELECTADYQGENTMWTSITSLAQDTCQSPSGMQGMTYCRLPAPINVAQGSCVASGGTLKDEPAWAQDVFTCPMAMAQKADEAGACLRQDGDIPTCPDGYANRTVVYKSETGNRACTQCSCTGECQTRITVYENGNCSGGNAVHVNSPAQTDVTSLLDDPTYSIKKVAPVPPSACLPTGGEAVEEVQPAEPVTICCK